jgi:hypothetical protein
VVVAFEFFLVLTHADAKEFSGVEGGVGILGSIVGKGFGLAVFNEDANPTVFCGGKCGSRTVAFGQFETEFE